ncbi:hypothetical protein GWI33_008277 [Rhynchophorus ferrugineus]|uniref:Brain-enriched guanylate kinase-associated protein n=1 Tax=Rhynchophorus ferrugineus TaxID=354439 RepID=A0A834MJA8_RHYFE|nr:hypothetical protein GWI33_008277 [Rhynchophorus ferrugineus]
MANNKCKECGCTCKKCLSSDHDVQLHVEIENLKQKLVEKENHIVMMETNFLNEANKFPSGEVVALREELLTWQDKYKRLYEAHRRVQRVNQGLEDKLLKLVDMCETEKNILTKDVATLSQNLAEANYAIKKLTTDNERYKNDVSLAVQFLQCKQTNFVAHKFDTLPVEVQTEVSSYMNNKRKPNEEKKIPLEPKSIKVPIPTFPPTAMVYSVPKSPRPDRRTGDDIEKPEVDIVSAAIMAKVLEERQKERALAKHCDTCTCAKSLKIIYDVTHHSVGTQTGEYKENVCLKCNEVIPQTNSLQIVKAIDEKVKRIPSYSGTIVPLPLETTQGMQNIVKVQPNNFLIDKEKSCSNESEKNVLKTSIHKSSTKNNSSLIMVDVPEVNTNVLSSDLIDFQDINTNDGTNNIPELHKFQGLSIVDEVIVENERSGTNKIKVSAGDMTTHLKSPLSIHTNSKNILLDNAHNNVGPVLLTRGHKNNTPSQTSHKYCDIAKKHYKQETESTSSHESKHISVVSENSVQHQQRISDWVQVTIENDNVSSSDNSRAEELKPHLRRPHKPKLGKNLDRVRYEEIEENVKRFLFGESEFMKTVEIGKLKYKNFRENEKCSFKGSRDGSRTTSHTETEI